MEGGCVHVFPLRENPWVRAFNLWVATEWQFGPHFYALNLTLYVWRRPHFPCCYMSCSFVHGDIAGRSSLNQGSSPLIPSQQTIFCSRVCFTLAL